MKKRTQVSKKANKNRANSQVRTLPDAGRTPLAPPKRKWPSKEDVDRAAAERIAENTGKRFPAEIQHRISNLLLNMIDAEDRVAAATREAAVLRHNSRPASIGQLGGVEVDDINDGFSNLWAGIELDLVGGVNEIRSIRKQLASVLAK